MPDFPAEGSWRVVRRTDGVLILDLYVDPPLMGGPLPKLRWLATIPVSELPQRLAEAITRKIERAHA